MKTYNNINYIRENIIRMQNDPQIIVDATCGNGNDTFFLAKTYENSKIYAFDIQIDAISNTKNRCNEFQNIEYINDSHSHLDEYINNKIDIMMFNLGFLPNYDKKIVTVFETTKEAILKGLDKLNNGGIIIITAYKGEENLNETMMLKKFLKKINKDKYIVSEYSLFNLDNAPQNFIIEKK